MLVIDEQTGYVSVQLNRQFMADLEKHVDAFIRQWVREPHKMANYVQRSGLHLTGPKLLAALHETTRRGFMGEKALADYLGVDYQLRVFAGYEPETDVDGVEVRTVDTWQKRLITHPYDKRAPFVLAVADHGTATVYLRGWLHLRHCNVANHWWAEAPHPAYFTPATALHPMASLLYHHQNRKRR